MPELNSHWNRDRFDEDQLGQLRADRQPRIANLANEICMAGDQPDDLVLTQADFPQAVLDFRSGTKLFDPHRHARLDAAQGT
jgi:hypothetical protein